MPTYFVYGALMQHKAIRQTAKPAHIKDYGIFFSNRTGIKIEPGFANLHPSPGNSAWGVMFTLDEKVWKKISNHEVSYDLTKLTAVDEEGHTHQVLALSSKKEITEHNASISARYAKLLYKSSRYYQFPNDVQQRYFKAYKQGSKLTLLLPWYVPLAKKLVPYFSLKTVNVILISGFILILFIFILIFYVLIK